MGLEKVVGNDHMWTLFAKMNLARLADERGEFPIAIKHLETMLQLCAEAIGWAPSLDRHDSFSACRCLR